MTMNGRNWMIAIFLFIDLCVAIGVYSTENRVAEMHVILFSISYLILILVSVILYIMTKPRPLSLSNIPSTSSTNSTEDGPKKIMLTPNMWESALKIHTILVSLFTGGLFGFCIGIKS